MAKHLYVPNPNHKNRWYEIHSYGRLTFYEENNTHLNVKGVFLTAEEIKEILSLEYQKRYQKCDEIFNAKIKDESETKYKELSQEEQSELEKLFFRLLQAGNFHK